MSEHLKTPPSADSNTPRDTIFADPEAPLTDFRFDEKTAAVFDDMVGRSVPFYAEIQRMIAEIAGDFAIPGTTLFDLGCSTATSLLQLDRVVDPGPFEDLLRSQTGG